MTEIPSLNLSAERERRLRAVLSRGAAAAKLAGPAVVAQIGLGRLASMAAKIEGVVMSPVEHDRMAAAIGTAFGRGIG